MANLRVDGEVDHPREISFEDLSEIETSSQISDVRTVGARRPGQAVKISALLALVGKKSTAKFIGLHASRDDFHASIPLADEVLDAVIVYGDDGKPLQTESGGPFRFFIPEHTECQVDEIDECANVKFVDHIELTVEKGYDNRPKDEAEHERLHQNEHQH